MRKGKGLQCNTVYNFLLSWPLTGTTISSRENQASQRLTSSQPQIDKVDKMASPQGETATNEQVGGNIYKPAGESAYDPVGVSPMHGCDLKNASLGLYEN